jgi:hypothetical protein|tara:strand:+ start:1504 stop:2304 length:801 start_codon:yes stop_codon:yes gene_type:complete
MKKLLFTHGCSFTFEANDGQIVQTWPTHLFKKLDMEIYNHGIGGFGNHGIFRQTMNWLSSNKDKWKNIFVVIQWTTCCRWEFFDKKEGTKKVNLEEIYNGYQDKDRRSWKQYHFLDENYKPHPYKTPIDYLSVTQEYYDRLILVVALQNFLKVNNIPYLFFDGISSYKFRNQDGTWFGFPVEEEIDYNLLNTMESFIDTKRYLELPHLAFCGHHYYSEQNFGLEYQEYQNKWKENVFDEDNYHPNTLGHEKWSEFLFTYIKENKLL